MKVKAIKCKACSTVIFSRYKYDRRNCSCDSLAIEGGPVEGNVFIRDKFSAYDPVELDLGKDLHEGVLLRDWLYKQDKLGIIKEE
jgi:hypothetical protein